MLISQLSDVWLKRVFAHYITVIFGMDCSTTAWLNTFDSLKKILDIQWLQLMQKCQNKTSDVALNQCY